MIMVVDTLSHKVSGNVFCVVATDLVGKQSISIDGAFDAAPPRRCHLITLPSCILAMYDRRLHLAMYDRRLHETGLFKFTLIP